MLLRGRPEGSRFCLDIRRIFRMEPRAKSLEPRERRLCSERPVGLRLASGRLAGLLNLYEFR
jgi:hypothetical protein